MIIFYGRVIGESCVIFFAYSILSVKPNYWYSALNSSSKILIYMLVKQRDLIFAWWCMRKKPNFYSKSTEEKCMYLSWCAFIYRGIDEKLHVTIFSQSPYLYAQEDFQKVVLPADLPKISNHTAVTPVSLLLSPKSSKTSLPFFT